MIKALSTEYRVQELCEALAVSPSGYYEWAGRKPGKRQEANQELAQKIQLVYADSRKTYGSPRIALTLQKQGVACGRKRVARLMKQNDIQGAQKARYKPRTTDSNHDLPISPNRKRRDRKRRDGLLVCYSRFGPSNVVLESYLPYPIRRFRSKRHSANHISATKSARLLGKYTRSASPWQ